MLKAWIKSKKGRGGMQTRCFARASESDDARAIRPNSQANVSTMPLPVEFLVIDPVALIDALLATDCAPLFFDREEG